MSARLEHFQRAAADIGAHGDNDTLPFDVDTKFIKDRQDEVASIAHRFFEALYNDSEVNNSRKISELSVFSERLLVPTGPAGFRISTKIHPFWSVYFNGLGIAIAETLEHQRSDCARSYRFSPNGGEELFDREISWRKFREETAKVAADANDGAVVVQSDISSFYEHISHHHIQNFINDLFQGDRRIGNQINSLLNKFSGGRSFGLPVGGQCSRILAELFMDIIDHQLTNAGVTWFRYVDDYALMSPSSADAYKALSVLSHTLADYGLTLNKTKTTFLTTKHYVDYVRTQIGGDDDEAGKLREIDVRFDPYSDTAEEDYESLRDTVTNLQVQKLLNRELEKALPDTFLVTQIGRTLRLHEPMEAYGLAATLLSSGNLHAFRASWSTIMRGVTTLRSTDSFEEIFAPLDQLLDNIPSHSSHLLQAEASLLHYLRTLRFVRTDRRANFVQSTYQSTDSETVRRGCIDCWRHWRDRASFTFLRNRWDQLSSESQRLVWLAAGSFGDQGDGFKRQVASNLEHTLRLGIERQGSSSYASIYRSWCDASPALA